MTFKSALSLFVATGLATAVITALIGAPAHAVQAVNVRPGMLVIDLRDAVEWHAGNGGRLMISTAPDSDGIVRYVDALAREAGASWAVFALANTSDQRIERSIVVPRSRMHGSRLSIARLIAAQLAVGRISEA